MSTLDGPPETSMPETDYPGADAPDTLETPVRPTPPAPPGPRLDRVEPLNLSRRPFLNSRPVVRVSLLLLLLGLALLLWNVVQFQRYLAESADKRALIERGDREVARQQQISTELQARLDALDLGQMNERVEFLNEMIAERTFSWSLLLDRLAETLPNDVRLVRLTPRVTSSEDRQRGRAARNLEEEDRRIPLGISAESRDDKALFLFVDNLFAHPAFADPDPTRQERADETSNLVRFEVNVQYIPGGSPQMIEEVPTVEELPVPGTPGTGPATPGAAGVPGAAGAPGAAGVSGAAGAPGGDRP